MVAVFLGMTLSVLDTSIVNLALPGIARDLHTGAAQTIWIVNAYQVAILALLLPLSMLGDLVGYRRVYLCGVAVFTLASLACAMAPTLGVLLLARGLQGLGAGGLMAVNAALVRLIYPRSLLGRGVALNSVVVATGAVAGPSIAAAILSVASWPWLFLVNLPLGAVVLGLGYRVLPRNVAPPPSAARLQAIDVVLNAAMFGLVFLGADALAMRPGAAAGSRAPGVAMLAAGLAIGAVYVRRQRRLAVPMLPLDLLRIPVFALSMCTSIGAFAAQTLAYVALPFLLLEVYGRSHLQAGLLITAWPAGVVVSAAVAGRLIGRFADGLLGALGLASLALGLLLLALLPAHPVDADIAWRLALCGIGFGLFQSPNNHTIVTSAPVHRSGGASGMLGTARLTGQIFGAVLLAGILSATSLHDGSAPKLALVCAAGLAAAASAFSALRVPQQKPLPTETSP
ncbi:MAG TPA: MFS transporter [Burkholderiaceae bacterium]